MSPGRVPLLLPIAVAAAFGVASVALPLGDNDVFWHLATAREALAHGLVRSDLFSWTVPGQPVATDQWLGQLLWYAAYLGAGWRGILALRTVTVAVLVAVIVWSALRESPRAPLVALIAALPAILLTRLVSVERPELFGVLCFAVLVPLLRSARAGSARALVFIPILVLIWADLHGSFALGVALVLGTMIAAAVHDDPARRRGLLLTAGATVLATLLTPAGAGVWTAPGFHLLHPPRAIQEWAVPDVTTLPGLVFAAVIVATFASAALSPARDPKAVIVLIPVLVIALTAVRHTPFFAIAAAPFLARHGPAAFAALVRRRVRVQPAGASPARTADLVAAVVALAVLGGALTVVPAVPDLTRYPAAALSSLASGAGLLNDYDWGGYLIWSAPRTPVFIDGRLTPYLPDVLADYTAVVEARPGWRQILTRRGVRELLVRPQAPVAVRARELGWSVRFLDDTAVLIGVP